MDLTSRATNRRHFLEGISLSLFSPAACLLAADPPGNITAPSQSTNRKPAKNIIYLFMSGGMSHLDTFDVKPNLDSSMRGDVEAKRSSADGIYVSQYFPRMAKQMHHVAVINSMVSATAAHLEARYLMHTSYDRRGTIIHPGLGAWMQVLRPEGRGKRKKRSEIPGNVVINGGSENPGAGFFEAKQGPLMIGNPAAGLADVEHNGSMEDLKYRRDLASKLDTAFQEQYSQRDVRAYRETYSEALALMQSSDLEVFNLDKEDSKTRERYGEGFGTGCLLARRLVEKGVSFVEVDLGGWDTHIQQFIEFPSLCDGLDRGMASLLEDLHDRGLLDDTLVVLATEFGRSPRINQNDGRDHHPAAFTCLLAGGGVKGGIQYGKTDATGFSVADKPVDVQDLNATIAYGLGLPLDRKVFSKNRRPFKVAHDGSAVKDLF